MQNDKDQHIEDVHALIETGVLKTKLEILITDFQSSKVELNDNLTRIYELIRVFPNSINDCKDSIELDLHTYYMTKKDGKLLEQHLSNSIMSIKIWIVASIGGFTAAGAVLIWYFKALSGSG